MFRRFINLIKTMFTYLYENIEINKKKKTYCVICKDVNKVIISYFKKKSLNEFQNNNMRDEKK